MKKPITLFSALMVALAAIGQDVNIAGPSNCNGAATTGTWQVPCNVTAITVQLYGAGGGGGGGGGGSNGGLFETRGGGGGGGGSYAAITLSVLPGDVFNYTIGTGGCGGANGSDGERGDDGSNGNTSTFSGTGVSLVAAGGAYGGSGSGSENDPGGGGAGGSATGGATNDNGAAGSSGSGGNGGAGGAGAGPLGGAGGSATNNPGSTYGGGGAGGGNSDGGHGAAGGLVIYYTDSVTVPTLVSAPATCFADGFTSISNYNSGLTYTFSPSGPTIGADSVINGMVAGDSYTLVATLGSCTTATSAAFSNALQLTAPAIPDVITNSATCLADGNSTINNYNAAYTYIFSPTGPTVGANGLISGMVVGDFYGVEAYDGSCYSDPSNVFSNDAQLTGTACDTTTTGIGSIETQVQLSIYPNPASKLVNLTADKKLMGKEVMLLNMNGQVLQQKIVNDVTTVIDISKLAAGVYIIKVGSATLRLVKHE